MPVHLPTPAEFAGLNWHARQRAVKNLRTLMRQYGAAIEEQVISNMAQRKAPSTARWVEFGEQVRAEARQLQGDAS